jgi:nickel transport protein
MIRLLALVLVLLSVDTAHAHRLRLFATVAGADISGYAYFVGGGRPSGATIRITTPGGRELARLLTDENGAFRTTAGERIDHVLTVDIGDGHRASTTIAAVDLPATLPRPADADALPSGSAATPVNAVTAAGTTACDIEVITTRIEQGMAHEIGHLRAALDANEARVRWSDVLGGLGTVFGVAGLWMMGAARRKLAGAR